MTIGLTVHVLGLLTPAVLSCLRPTMLAIAGAKRPQALILLEDEFAKQHLGELPAGIDCTLLRDPKSIVERVLTIKHQFALAARKQSIGSVHLHGVVPTMAASSTLRSLHQPRPEVTFYPHSSRALIGPGFLRSAVVTLMRVQLRRIPRQAIVATAADARHVRPLFREKSVKRVEQSTGETFFRIERDESPQALVLTGGHFETSRQADAFARLAVLMGDEKLGLKFEWLGPVESSFLPVLRAAGVAVNPAASAEERAARLACAWVYVSSAPDRGISVGLAEAMATGLPVVALPGQGAQAVVEDGTTGFICRDQLDMVHRLAELIDSRDLRARLGGAARQHARSRFSDDAFAVRISGQHDADDAYLLR